MLRFHNIHSNLSSLRSSLFPVALHIRRLVPCEAEFERTGDTRQPVECGHYQQETEAERAYTLERFENDSRLVLFIRRKMRSIQVPRRPEKYSHNFDKR